MATWPAEGVGCILTSPPYNIGLDYDGFNDNMPHGEFVEFNRQWLIEAARVCRETARIYVIVGRKMKWWFKPSAEAVGLNFVQELTWCKPNLVNSSRGMRYDWSPMTEPILLFRKGKRTPMLNAASILLSANTFDWFVETVPQSNFREGRIHPAQLPLSLCQKIIARTPGEPVLDPFAGSGQVLRAAQSLGRSWIGIELVPSVAEAARRFIAAPNLPRVVEVSQMPLVLPAE